MTIPQNVADAVRRCDQSAEDSPHDESNWYVVRAELYRMTDDLVAKEAEIERKEQEWSEMFDRALVAESRLAVSNALLREWLSGKWCTPEYNAARQRAYDHLQGSGDEA